MTLTKENIIEFLNSEMSNGVYVNRLITNNFDDYLKKPALDENDFLTIVSFMTTNGVLVQNEKGEYETVEDPKTVSYEVTLKSDQEEAGIVVPGYGVYEVEAGTDFQYDVVASDGYRIKAIHDNGKRVAEDAEKYAGVIENIQEDHTIDIAYKDHESSMVYVQFEPESDPKKPVGSVEFNGTTIYTNGEFEVERGSEPEFKIKAAEGYTILKIDANEEEKIFDEPVLEYTYTFEPIESESYVLKVIFAELEKEPEEPGKGPESAPEI